MTAIGGRSYEPSSNEVMTILPSMSISAFFFLNFRVSRLQPSTTSTLSRIPCDRSGSARAVPALTLSRRKPYFIWSAISTLSRFCRGFRKASPANTTRVLSASAFAKKEGKAKSTVANTYMYNRFNINYLLSKNAISPLT